MHKVIIAFYIFSNFKQKKKRLVFSEILKLKLAHYSQYPAINENQSEALPFARQSEFARSQRVHPHEPSPDLITHPQQKPRARSSHPEVFDRVTDGLFHYA